MYEDSPAADLSRSSNPSPDKVRKAPFNWRSLPIDVLIEYRDEITKCLPPLALKDMNLEEELLLQFHAVRSLQNNVITDAELPLNQRAQVANAVANTLTKLIDMQESVYTQERFKAIEMALIRALGTLPEDAAKAFIDQYEKVLETQT